MLKSSFAARGASGVAVMLCWVLPCVAQTPEPNCGITSVMALASARGTTLSPEQSKRLLSRFPQEEVSLAQVQEIAAMAGTPLRGVKAGLEDLLALQQPVIVHLTKPEHFVVLDGKTSEGVRLLENTGFVFQKQSEFNTRFSGFALIPARTRTATASIRFEQTDFNAGNVALRHSVKHLFLFRNVGGKPVTVTQEKVSCGCTGVVLGGTPNTPAVTLAPGQSSTIALSYDVNRVGQSVEHATLKTDDPLMPQVRISLRANVPQSVQASTDVVRLNADKGQEASRTFFVVTPPAVEVQGVEGAPEHIKASFALEEQTPVARRWKFLVRQDKSAPLGESSSTLTIRTSDKDSPAVPIGIQSAVRGALEVKPARVFLGMLRRGEEVTAKIRLASRKGANATFRVLSSNLENKGLFNGIPEITASTTARSQDAAQVVEFTVRVRPKSEHQVQDVLVITTDVEGEEQVRVPISGLVQAAAQDAALPRAEDDPLSHVSLATPNMKVGDHAPLFAFTDLNGRAWKAQALQGRKNVLLTFFPRCFTGGCANHLSSLRDQQAVLDASNTQVLAVSVDPADGEKGQKAFAQQWQLKFPLIPDTTREISVLFGAVQKPQHLAARMSILIDKQGIVRYIDTSVNVRTHGADMVAKLKELGLDK